MENKNTTSPRTGQDAHTPTPWHLARILNRRPDMSGVLNIRSGDVNVLAIADRNETDEANAAFIVRACNEYASDKATIAALVAALEGFLAAMKGNSSDLAEAAFEAKRVLAAARNP